MCLSAQIYSQNCIVDNLLLQGTYKGGCKNGKANGNGKATGTDFYEGNFVMGFPHGQGTYRWQNGNIYTGWFVNGLKDGEGKLVYKSSGGKDSIITGLWKKDLYAGPVEKIYRLIFKSKLVTDIETEFKNDSANKITFFITNTSGGAKLVDGDELPRLKVDEVVALKGSYGRLYLNDNHVKKTESLIEEVGFPFRMRALIGTEEVEMEFLQPGSYIINLRIND